MVARAADGLRPLGLSCEPAAAIISVPLPSDIDIKAAVTMMESAGIFVNYAVFPAVPRHQQTVPGEPHRRAPAGGRRPVDRGLPRRLRRARAPGADLMPAGPQGNIVERLERLAETDPDSSRLHRAAGRQHRDPADHRTGAAGPGGGGCGRAGPVRCAPRRCRAAARGLADRAARGPLRLHAHGRDRGTAAGTASRLPPQEQDRAGAGERRARWRSSPAPASPSASRSC